MKYLFMLIFLGGWVVPVFAQEDVPVVVTTQPLPRGTVLTEEILLQAVEIQFWEAEFLPQTAIQDTSLLIGKVVKLDLAVRTPILSGAIVDQTPDAARIGSDSALLVPVGQVGVPLRVDNLFYAPPDLSELACVTVSAILDFGTEQPVEYILTDQGVVVENAYALAAEVVAVGMPPDSAVIAIWFQDHAIPLALVYSSACPSG